MRKVAQFLKFYNRNETLYVIFYFVGQKRQLPSWYRTK